LLISVTVCSHKEYHYAEGTEKVPHKRFAKQINLYLLGNCRSPSGEEVDQWTGKNMVYGCYPPVPYTAQTFYKPDEK
jgi:hypothetical protein